MEGRLQTRHDSDTQLTGRNRAAVVAALARMVVAELERELLLPRSEPLQPQTADHELSTEECA